MAIETQCDQCGKRYRVKDELAGRRIKCKQCGAKIVVEDPFAAADDWGTTDYADDGYGNDDYGADPFGGGDDPYGTAAPPPRKKRKKKQAAKRQVSSGKPFWKLPVGILGMIGCMVLLVLGVISVFDGRIRAARAVVGALVGLVFCFNLAFGSESDA